MALKEDDVKSQNSSMIACRDEKQTIQLTQREATKYSNIMLKSEKQQESRTSFTSWYLSCSHAGILQGKWHQRQK